MANNETANQPGKHATEPAATGNASNPSPADNRNVPADDQQLLGKEAEKYLREVASIEDVPDAQDQEEMDETIAENNNE